MSSQIRIVKEKLNLAITQLCETSWMFVKNPNRDFILESVKKLEKLFIAPRARQILHETAHRAFARCECA